MSSSPGPYPRETESERKALLLDPATLGQIRTVLKEPGDPDALTKTRANGTVYVSLAGAITVAEFTDLLYPGFENLLIIDPSASATLRARELAQVIRNLDHHGPPDSEPQPPRTTRCS